jgi:hypothetical protein
LTVNVCDTFRRPSPEDDRWRMIRWI